MLLFTAFSADELIFFFALHAHMCWYPFIGFVKPMLLFFLNSLFNVNQTDKETIKQLDKLDTLTKFKFVFDVPRHVYNGSLHYTQ